MIVETQLVGEAYVELDVPDVARQLRAALSAHEIEIRGIEVRLRHEADRHCCRLCVAFHQGERFTIEKRGETVDSAVALAIQALLQAVGQMAVSPSTAPQARGRGRTLLLALPACGHPTGSLVSASQLALQTGRSLHVARVLPLGRRACSGSSQSPVVEHTLEALRLLAACRETRDWCDLVLRRRLPALHIAVRSGEFVSQITQRARELQAELICVPHMNGRAGSIVAALARATGLPVLVARPPGTRHGILAAADLADESYPVVRKAAELARAMPSDVLLLHDLPRDTRSAPHFMSGHTPATTLDLTELQRQRLLRAAQRWVPDGKVVVTRENNPARAIVNQAASCGVETIVVGTRAHPWLARRMARTVAAQVVETADRSVLVVPIERAAALEASGISTGPAIARFLSANDQQVPSNR